VRVELLINKSAAAIASTIAVPTAAAQIKEVYLPSPGVKVALLRALAAFLACAPLPGVGN
jgi:hypothetical protein